MRQTIHKVREELGADAVILSNKRVNGGIEIVAAIDYDESLLGGMSWVKSKKTNKQDAEPASSRQDIWNDVRMGRDIPDVDTTYKKPTKKAPGFNSDRDMTVMQDELKSLRNLLVHQLSGLAWGNEKRYHPIRARLMQRMIALGLSPKMARDVCEQVNEDHDFTHSWRMALGILAHRIPMAHTDILKDGGIVAVMGATGVGKTTTVAKLAARYILQHGTKSVGLISADNQRVASHAQLRSYARILGVPIRTVSDVESLQDAISGFHDKQLILIDTAGMGASEMQLNTQLAQIKEGRRHVRPYLVMATNSQRGVLTETSHAFANIDLAGCIFSKVDETTSLGGAISVAIEANIPVAYLCDGQAVPDDLHRARAHNLVSRSVAIMQQVGAGMKEDSVSVAIGGLVAHAHG